MLEIVTIIIHKNREKVDFLGVTELVDIFDLFLAWQVSSYILTNC